ncbi:MBL fold metallo-hydrolase [Gemmatimonas sp.]|uniref:MBL fold metallo-hydrolase n=1 Tax=Gemmatimonas sp. TaxID=1962908 RepID=UPI00286E59A4|nr:MBL fold metallo-hydrolase [Gemmatimonas sp.]
MRYGGNTPCVELRAHDDGLLILDAGTGIRALGAQLMSDGDDRTAHIFLSHRHSDHVLGLSHFAPLITQAREVGICCGDGETASLQPFVDALLSPPMFPYVDGIRSRLDVCDWDLSNARQVGTSHVHRFAARHPGEAAVLRFDDEHGPAVAYAPDNELGYADESEAAGAWRVKLTAFLRDVPVLIHDATYLDSELPKHVGWGHSSSLEATRLAIECGAGMLVLFHHHPDRDDDTIERMVEESRAMATATGSTLRVLAAWEGLALTV